MARGCEESVVRRSTSRTGTLVARQLDRGGQAGRAGADHQDGDVFDVVVRGGMDAIVGAPGRRPPEQRLLNRARVARSGRSIRLRACRGRSQGAKPSSRFVAEALADGAAGGVVVAGPAGVGKTRLAVEVAAARERAGAARWRGCGRRAPRPRSRSAPSPRCCPPRSCPEGVELLARARDALAERAAGRRLVLCVDDGQLLDDASAALVHQLVAAGEAFAVVTVRRGEPVPDALRALWKDELCAGAGAAGALARRGRRPARRRAGRAGRRRARVSHDVGADARQRRCSCASWRATGVDRGLLAEDGGVWRWRGRVEAGTRLAELVDLRIDGVGAGAREPAGAGGGRRPAGARAARARRAGRPGGAGARRARGAPHRRAAAVRPTSPIRSTARRCARG